MKFDINVNETVDRDEQRYSNEPYDYSWREDHDFTYNGALIIKDNKWSDVNLFPDEAEVEAGDEIYVVYVSYDTGDSFGHSSGERVHLWAFSDKARAHRLCTTIEADATAHPDYDFDNKPLTFDDVPIGCNTWKGYFENFRGADVETIVVRRR